ncbi:unnamed protein product, partial [marine sediment metagenome]
KRYKVELEFCQPFASSLPRTAEEIATMLQNRMPSKAALMNNPIAVEDLGEQVAEEVGASEEAERGWATFKRDEEGIYYEARCVRAHIKDCAQQLAGALQIRGLKAKVANRVYVEPEQLRLTRTDGTPVREVDGTETRMIHVLTRRGPRNGTKQVDYVAPPCRLAFMLKVLDDGQVDRDILEAIFEYGGTHGMGQERSQQWGQYGVVAVAEV